MKKLFIIFLLVLAGDLNKSFPWDPEAAKYFPLAVGNQWSYRHRNFAQFSCIPAGFFDFVVSIVSDTTMANGRRYFKFSNGPLMRIDSATMNVYQYSGGLNECLVDSLLARINDTMRTCQFNRTVMNDTTSIMFAGSLRKTMKFQTILVGEFFRQLMYGIGKYYEILCEGGGYSRSLNGAIINGVQYGQMLGVGIIQISSEIPEQFSLSQNYPNPFNPVTNIKFQIPESGVVKLTVFDILGKEVRTLVNKELSPGTYETDFDGSNLPSGVYYYKLETKEFTETKKMVLIK